MRIRDWSSDVCSSDLLTGTAKPYFGDVAQMTYRQWLERYVELAVGEATGAATWVDVTWRQRFIGMLQRAEARLNDADRGEIPTLFGHTRLDESRVGKGGFSRVWSRGWVDIIKK